MSCCPTPLTPEEREVLTARLKEAEAAFHTSVIGGQARTFVDQNGERVEYNPANALRLRAYIFDLRVALGLPLRGICGPLRADMLP